MTLNKLQFHPSKQKDKRLDVHLILHRLMLHCLRRKMHKKRCKKWTSSCFTDTYSSMIVVFMNALNRFIVHTSK